MNTEQVAALVEYVKAAILEARFPDQYWLAFSEAEKELYRLADDNQSDHEETP